MLQKVKLYYSITLDSFWGSPVDAVGLAYVFVNSRLRESFGQILVQFPNVVI